MRKKMGQESEYSIETEKYKQYLVIRFINYEGLDLYNIKELGEVIQVENEKGTEDFIIDMSPIKFIDSSGLGMLARQGGYLSKKNKKLNLVSLSPSVIHLFRAVGFDKLFAVSASLESL